LEIDVSFSIFSSDLQRYKGVMHIKGKSVPDMEQLKEWFVLPIGNEE
jgi:hypothetical protein